MEWCCTEELDTSGVFRRGGAARWDCDFPRSRATPVSTPTIRNVNLTELANDDRPKPQQ